MGFRLKQLFPSSLFGRSLLILVTPVLLIQIITTYVFFDRHWDKMTERLADAVAGEIAVMASEIEQTPDDVDQIKKITSYAIQNLNFIISYQSGEHALENNEDHESSIVIDILSRSMEQKVRRPFVIYIDIEEKWLEVRVKLEAGLLSISLPQRRLFSSSAYIFLLWMIGSSIVLLAIAILFMRNQIRPIRRLAMVAERFGKGQDIPKNFKAEGAREVRRAANAFLDMRERLQRQIEQRMIMLAGVSHDLRTPLTRMKLQTAMLEKSPDVEALKQDIEDMERMIDAYLEFVRGQGSEQPESLNLSHIVDNAIARHKRTQQDIVADIEPDIMAMVRPVAFDRCIHNIFNNGRKYASRIWVSLESVDDYAVIHIDDNGEGIPEEQYDEVFKPFYRIESSRNPETGGVGLGLPISLDIMLAHGGTIDLSKSPHGGLRVTLKLPL